MTKEFEIHKKSLLHPLKIAREESFVSILVLAKRGRLRVREECGKIYRKRDTEPEGERDREKEREVVGERRRMETERRRNR